MYKKNIKIAILGTSMTGKTTIAYRLIGRENNDIHATIGANFLSMTLNEKKYEIWDTAGQERFLSLVEMYFRGSNIMLLVFSLDWPESIKNFDFYLKKISDHLETNSGHLEKNFKLFIVGNKLDLIQNENKNVNKIQLEIEKKLSENNIPCNETDFIYISAKTGQNFEELINKIREFGDSIKEIQPFDNFLVDINELKGRNNYCNC